MKTIKALLLAAALLGLSGCASTGAFFDEASTTAKVKKAIYSEPSLKVMDISVSTEDGVVELNGSVKSRAERAKAGQVAAKVEGVKKVNNQLKVVSQ
jgi:osmotically-inducible protein OsmY